MNIVWPVTGMYAGPLALIAYYTTGRKSLKKNSENAQYSGNGNMEKKPFWQSVVVGTLIVFQYYAIKPMKNLNTNNYYGR